MYNVLTCGRVTWTNIEHPSPEDIRALAGRYPQFHPLNLQDCLNEQEMPKLDHHDDYLFLVVQFPYWESPDEIPQPAEVDIFIARGNLVTSHRGKLPALERLFEQAQAEEAVRQQYMAQGASPLLYHLLATLVDGCFPFVQQVGHSLRSIEAELFHAPPRQVLRKIALLRRTVIALRHILAPQSDVVEALGQGNWSFVHEELDLYWSDISDHLAQLRARLDEHAEVVAGLSDTIDTLASHQIDDVVRLLTIVTVLTLPLTLLATIFGMNILMPFAGHPLLFYGVVAIGIALTLLLVWYLNRRKWL